MGSRRIWLYLAMSIFFVPRWSFAQQAKGTMFGTVTDSSGAAAARTKVTVANMDTGAEFIAICNDQGTYVAPGLAVGRYRVTAQLAGFKQAVRTGVVLSVDQRERVDFQLELGSATDSVTVHGDSVLVDTAAATVGKVVENRRLNDLPVNGRNAFALVMLTPNVKSNAGPTNMGFADRGTDLSSISINGGPSAMNNFMLDGGTDNNAWFSDINTVPTVDAVEEFKVQSNVMSAEFGFTMGGVINVVTKSGTNALHGNLYEFLRNDAFDSRNTFAAVKPPLRYNQFGGSLGGPIVIPKIYNGHNRTFFFFNYEGWKYRRASNPIDTLPTPLERQGDFSNTRDSSGRVIPIYDPFSTAANPAGSGFVRDIFPGNVIPKSRLDPVALNYLQFYPLPNRTPTDRFTNSNNFISNIAETRSMQQYTNKIDHRFGDRNSLFGRYTYFRHATDGGGSQSDLPDPLVRLRNDNLENRNLVLSDTHTFSPHLLNEFRGSLNRQYFPFLAEFFNQGLGARLGMPASTPPTCIPRVSNGLPGMRTCTSGIRGTVTTQLYDAVTLIRGGHTIKLGADIRWQQGNNLQYGEASGSYTFPATLSGNPQSPAGTGSAFATFLTGAVGSATANTALGQTELAHSYSFFVQDDWKVFRRLVVNLGLRYDYQQWPVERHNGTSNFDPYAINPLNGLLGRMEYAGKDYGRSAQVPDYKDFGPRIGLSYDLFGNGKTVFRAGYAIFYPTMFFVEAFGNPAGFASTNTTYTPPGGNTNLPVSQFKDGLPGPVIQPQGSLLGPSGFLGSAVTFDEANGRVPMSQQWTASFQRQVGGWVFEAGYSANHGTHLLSNSYDLNQLPASLWSLGLALQQQVPNPYAGKVPGSLGNATISRMQSLLAFPYYTSVQVRFPHMGNSIYQALLLSAEKRFSGGLAFLASYTKSKLISDNVLSPVRFGNVEQVGLDPYQDGLNNRRIERSLDPTNVAQRFVTSTVYELPVGRGKRWALHNRLLAGALGDWQVNAITTIQTGLPILITGANNFRAIRPSSTGKSAYLDDRTLNRWFDTSAFVNPPSFALGTLGPTLPDVRTPGTFDIDFSINKSFRFTEKVRLQIRGEAFNVLNHVNPLGPNTSFVPGPSGTNTNGAFGVITAARDPRTIQLGAKVYF